MDNHQPSLDGLSLRYQQHHHQQQPATAMVVSPAIPLSIPYWIKLADQLSNSNVDDYVKSGVNLAVTLTTQLLQLVARSQLQLNSVFDDLNNNDNGGNNNAIAPADITVNKVLVLAETPSPSSSASVVEPARTISIRSVQFQNRGQAYYIRDVNYPRLICAALGNILLEIFSKGRSSSLPVSTTTTDAHMDVSNLRIPSNQAQEQDQELYDAFMSPPSHKRRVPSGAATTCPSSTTTRMNYKDSNSISDSVNSLLLECEMPLSIRRLVCDLLDAISEPCPSTALTSLQAAYRDLTCMLKSPHLYLFDRTCPKKALEDTMCLFQNSTSNRNMNDADDDDADADANSGRHHFLSGRKKELGTLMDAKRRFASHIRKNTNQDLPSKMSMLSNNNGDHDAEKNDGVMFFEQENVDFYCEMVLLSGYSGIGKSALLKSLINACNEEKWFVIPINYDKQILPINAAMNGFNDFFGTWVPPAAGSPGSSARSNNQQKQRFDDPEMMEPFHQACDSIYSTVGDEGLRQLCECLPNLRKVFPTGTFSAGTSSTTARRGRLGDEEMAFSSIDKVGSAVNRRTYLLQVIVKCLCSVGKPLLIAHDDIQWSDSWVAVKDFIANFTNIPCILSRNSRYCGCYVVGTYREHELNDATLKDIQFIEDFECTRVTKLAIREMDTEDVTQLLSSTLCLPGRHTRELAGLVVTKTRGNPFFVIQFLRSIVQNKMLSFSVRARRWEWDCDVVDMQMISDGVAELLTTRFDQLPVAMMKTLNIASCLGHQLEESTIVALNSRNEVLPFSMQHQLQLAIQEGIMEKAGPLYQFTHEIIRKTIYEHIPPEHCKLLHKMIGESLLNSGPVNDIYLLAVDQINIYCKDAVLSQEKRSQHASINATAAKFTMASSSFERARCYIDVGMNLLGTDRWTEQYSLCLDLYEMSASVSCFKGDINTMSRCLHETIANVKCFEDGLTSSTLLAKLLAASSKYDEAVNNCLSILSTLGEEFPQDISLPIVLNELSTIQTTLANITVDQMKLLPPMTDGPKLKAMKFLSIICVYSTISKPMMLPLISCRMVSLMTEYGFCDDSIIGLVTAGWTLYTFTDKIKLGYRIIKVAESLIQSRPTKSIIYSYSRSCGYIAWLKAVVEPVQSVMCDFGDAYTSSMLAGDIGNAMLNRWAYCAASLYLHGGIPLVALSKNFANCVQHSAKYQQNTVLYATMSHFRACIYLTGETQPKDATEKMSYEEIDKIGQATNNRFLIYHNVCL